MAKSAFRSSSIDLSITALATHSDFARNKTSDKVL